MEVPGMVLHVYGDDKNPAIVLLHPMAVTGEKIYDLIGSRMKGDYCFLVPDMGNHGDDYGNYQSAESEAASLYFFLKDRNRTRIALLYGASMGAVTALELLKYDDLKIDNIYLDGAPIARQSWIMRRIFAPVLLRQKIVFAKGNYTDVKEFLDRWGRDITEHMSSCFERFSSKTIRCISKDCVRGISPVIPEDLQRHMYLEWGSRELYAKSSPKKVKKCWPFAHICVRKGYNHCEYMMKENENYISFIERILHPQESGL